MEQSEDKKRIFFKVPLCVFVSHVTNRCVIFTFICDTVTLMSVAYKHTFGYFGSDFPSHTHTHHHAGIPLYQQSQVP